MYNVTMRKNISGFTLVELLIVIVVIAILAAISVVAYNGIQERSRDSVRSSDIGIITKALALYYVEHGQYPQITATAPGLGPGGAISTSPFTPTWNDLQAQLAPYVSEIPKDPLNRNGSPNYRYSYRSYTTTAGLPFTCTGFQPMKVYLLEYRSELDDVIKRTVRGCSNNPHP